MKNCLVPERLAARFTRANSEYLSRANHANFSGHANGWWIALWVYLEQLPSVAGGSFSLWDTSDAANHGCHLSIATGNDKYYVQAYGVVSDKTTAASPVALQAGKWHFLYADYDGAALRHQLDDNVIGSTVYADYVVSASALSLGRRNNNTQYADARIQCVMCGHPNILTAAEIAWLYSIGPNLDGFNCLAATAGLYGTEFCNVARWGAYGDGVGIPAKTTFAAPLQEESNGLGAVVRTECYGLTLTDNNTVTSARGTQP